MQVTYGQNFDFKIKRANVKHSYEWRTYKSVNYSSYISKIGRKKYSCCRWLIVKAFYPWAICHAQWIYQAIRIYCNLFLKRICKNSYKEKVRRKRKNKFFSYKEKNLYTLRQVSPSMPFMKVLFFRSWNKHSLNCLHNIWTERGESSNTTILYPHRERRSSENSI